MKLLNLAIVLSVVFAPLIAKRSDVPERFLYKSEESMKHLYEFDKELFWDVLEALFLYDTRVVEHSPWLLSKLNWALAIGAIDVNTILDHFGTPDQCIQEGELHENDIS